MRTNHYSVHLESNFVPFDYYSVSSESYFEHNDYYSMRMLYAQIIVLSAQLIKSCLRNILS